MPCAIACRNKRYYVQPLTRPSVMQRVRSLLRPCLRQSEQELFGRTQAVNASRMQGATRLKESRAQDREHGDKHAFYQ